MTDTTLTPNEPFPQKPKSINMREQIEAEGEAGKAAAEGNAEQQEKAIDQRARERVNFRDIASQRAAIGERDLADRAEKVRGMVKDMLPPPGPGLPQVDAAVIAATMDPNNPVLNPDMSEVGRTRGLPPGARVPAPVLPQDTVQTQFASKPPTEEHAKEGEETAKGLPEPIYPPAGSQPTMELTQEEQAQQDQQRGQQQIGAPSPLAQPYPSPVAPSPVAPQQGPQQAPPFYPQRR
jgi:hypothetical protein